DLPLLYPLPLLHYLHVLVSFYCVGPIKHLQSFPTRRSSDLVTSAALGNLRVMSAFVATVVPCEKSSTSVRSMYARLTPLMTAVRSEEHTSELQSRFDLVCRLLLEKKNAPNAACHGATRLTPV